MTRLSKALNYKRSKDISQRPYTWIEYNIVFESDCLCLSIFLFSPWSPVTHDHYYSIIATALDLYLKIIFTLRSEEMKIIVNWIYLQTEVGRRIMQKARRAPSDRHHWPWASLRWHCFFLGKSGFWTSSNILAWRFFRGWVNGHTTVIATKESFII